MNHKVSDGQAGARLRQIRQHRKISQGQLAKVISVSVGTIQNYERGRVSITTDRVQQFARAMQCEPADLLQPPGSPPPRYRHPGARNNKKAPAREPGPRRAKD